LSNSAQSDDLISARFRHQLDGFTLDVDLNIPGSGVTAIFGRSGAGKTTLLRCIAGLQRPREGYLRVRGELWQDSHHWLPTHKRPLGYVFQQASLFAHLSARDNLRYAQKRADPHGPKISFAHTVELLGIGELLDRRSGQLSGGERQRVAIARTLLIAPRLLLMDEPLASLDMARKLEILPYLERLRSELDMPMLYVSHAPDEVARLADHIVALDHGKVVAAGPLQETLARLDFPLQLGEEVGVVLTAKVVQRDAQWQLARVAFAGGEFLLSDSGHEVGEQLRVRVLARDVSLALSRHDDSSILNVIAGVVDEISTHPSQGVAMVRIKIGETILVARVTLRSLAHLQLTVGKSIWVQIKSVAVIQ